MDMFLLFLANGIMQGSVYALVAIGITIIFSIMRIVNFAHGECYMIGAYVTWAFATRLVDNYWLALLVAVAAGALLGFLIEKLAFRPIYKTPGLSQFIISLGLVIIMQELVVLNFTGLPQALQSDYPTVRRIGEFVITDQRLIAVGLTAFFLIAILLFFRRTRTGKAMRATAANELAASLVGVKIERMASLAFIGGVALAAAAGALLAPIFSLNPLMGTRLTGMSFIIIVMGGMGSIGGAIIAGFGIGVAESLFSGYLSTQWSFALGFVILILVLKFRPQGLFGRG